MGKSIFRPSHCPPPLPKLQNQDSKANNSLFIHTPDKWTTAFIVFVAIYSEQIPNQTPGLMKHMEIVRELGSRGGNAWKTYDENRISGNTDTNIQPPYLGEIFFLKPGVGPFRQRKPGPIDFHNSP